MILAVFLIFCRVGVCMMIVPGFSSSRIALKVRLFLALTVSLAMAPVVIGGVESGITGKPPFVLLGLIVVESLTGLTIGFLGRIYFVALQTLVTGIAMAIGFGSIPGTPFDDSEPLPAIGTMIMMVATAMLFLTDLHWELLRGLAASYSRLPIGEGFGARFSLVQVVDQITSAFVVALRISAPFIIYSVVVNLAVGLTNKLTPQIPVYFLATPFIMLGGLFLMYYLTTDFMTLFFDAFSTWLANG